MVHGSVSHKHKLENVLRRQPSLFCCVSNDLVQPPNYCTVHLLKPVLVGHGIGDSCHHILTVHYLRIHHRVDGNYLTGAKIGEIPHHSGCADVDCKTHHGVINACFDLDYLSAIPDSNSNLPVAFPQDIRKTAKGRKIHFQTL